MDLNAGPSEGLPGATQNPANRDLAVHLPGLLEAAGITHVQVATFTKDPSFHGDSSTAEAKAITSAARAEHLARHFGFWEYALRAAVDADHESRQYLLNGALRHNSGDELVSMMSSDDFITNLQTGRYDGLDERTIVSLTSPVRLRGVTEQWHLPMLDLGVRVGSAGREAAIESLQALSLQGLLFESGRSYHFYGAHPLPPSQLWKLLGRAQLLSPIIDARWISHQLIDGRCGLRISTDKERHLAHHQYVTYVS